MRIKHILTVAGLVLLLSFGSTMMAQKNHAARNDVRASCTENRPGARLFFLDENGDGICDSFRDHDGDGIPNGQDPDWERPLDGDGYQEGKGGQQDRGGFANRNNFREQNGDSQYRRSFRYRRNVAGSPNSVVPGPKGSGSGHGGK